MIHVYSNNLASKYIPYTAARFPSMQSWHTV